MAKIIDSVSPIDGSSINRFIESSPIDLERTVNNSVDAFLQWRQVPPPKRGEFVRQLGNSFRDKKDELANIITLEVGKTNQEALGEVQEVIDICDFAVGLSRQLYGLTIASERPQHRLMEQWHPLGPVGVITAFNFPMAVWAWNATLAFVCGDSIIWKPSEKALECAVACDQIVKSINASSPPNHLNQMIIGRAEAGKFLAANEKIPLISATGSVAMGRNVNEAVARRLGKCLLELGGNNAAIVAPSADLSLTIRGAVFSAIGTAGQRCTSLRRLIVHESIFDKVVGLLKEAYSKIDPKVHMGPLIDRDAYNKMQAVLNSFDPEIVFGGSIAPVHNYAHYVSPALVINPDLSSHSKYINEETFAPILYVMPYKTLEEAIALQNSVPQGLSSSIFTKDIKEAELFCSATGSDCGIVNVNIGTSGAEIGGAFGGEKETGGGRESGSDAWKSYMRRATNTINYSSELPLAQGIEFDI